MSHTVYGDSQTGLYRPYIIHQVRDKVQPNQQHIVQFFALYTARTQAISCWQLSIPLTRYFRRWGFARSLSRQKKMFVWVDAGVFARRTHVYVVEVIEIALSKA